MTVQRRSLSELRRVMLEKDARWQEIRPSWVDEADVAPAPLLTPQERSALAHAALAAQRYHERLLRVLDSEFDNVIEMHG